MIYILIRLINSAVSLYILLIILHSVLSFVLDYYHPIRQFLEKLVGPLLNPIRRVVPLIGMFDISPMILIFLLIIVQSALVNFLNTLR